MTGIGARALACIGPAGHRRHLAVPVRRLDRQGICELRFTQAAARAERAALVTEHGLTHGVVGRGQRRSLVKLLNQGPSTQSAFTIVSCESMGQAARNPSAVGRVSDAAVAHQYDSGEAQRGSGANEVEDQLSPRLTGRMRAIRAMPSANLGDPRHIPPCPARAGTNTDGLVSTDGATHVRPSHRGQSAVPP